MVWTIVEDISIYRQVSSRAPTGLWRLFVLPGSRWALFSSFFFLLLPLRYLHSLSRFHEVGSSVGQFRRPFRRDARRVTTTDKK